MTWSFPWLTLTRCCAPRQDRGCPLLETGPETLEPQSPTVNFFSLPHPHKHMPLFPSHPPEGTSQHRGVCGGKWAMNSLSEQPPAQWEAEEGLAASGWEFTDGQEGGRAGDVIPEPVL